MDAKKIQQFYLRAMYTNIPADAALSVEEQFVLNTMELDRLDIERAARLRNLRTVLHDDMHLLNKLISKTSLLEYVEAYAASNYFWQHRGRTLIEDFCLYFVEHGAKNKVIKLVAEIEGVHSGLSTLSSSHTPWPEHKVVQDSGDLLEVFSAPFAVPWRILDDNKEMDIPAVNPGMCQMRRTSNDIRIKFIKEERDDATSNWLGVRLPA